MSKLTERMLQLAIVIAILYFGWGFASATVITILQLNNRASAAEQQLAACNARAAQPTTPPKKEK